MKNIIVALICIVFVAMLIINYNAQTKDNPILHDLDVSDTYTGGGLEMRVSIPQHDEEDEYDDDIVLNPKCKHIAKEGVWRSITHNPAPSHFPRHACIRHEESQKRKAGVYYQCEKCGKWFLKEDIDKLECDVCEEKE